MDIIFHNDKSFYFSFMFKKYKGEFKSNKTKFKVMFSLNKLYLN